MVNEFKKVFKNSIDIKLFFRQLSISLNKHFEGSCELLRFTT